MSGIRKLSSLRQGDTQSNVKTFSEETWLVKSLADCEGDELEEVQYLPLRHILKPNYQHHEGLTRSQVEIVAGRISAINECFF